MEGDEWKDGGMEGGGMEGAMKECGYEDGWMEG